MASLATEIFAVPAIRHPGAVVGPPCMVPVKTYKTFVENGRVMIETEQA